MATSGLAYYRKYRPQTLEQLIGQNHIKKSLQQAYQAGKLSHAYLLTGPRGTGKTSTARILAKMVNCAGQDSSELKPVAPVIVPCNKCLTCLSITDGSNLDLIEIDAASNRGIDDIRELRDKIKLAPTSSKKKVYIIDEVHMLTNEAFNALLKTLEEPPEHALFILATTDVQKIPQTILSRVSRLDFKLATIQDLVSALKNVTMGEKIKIDDEALVSIAKKGEGSFRDSLKILDQLVSGNEKITLQIVENFFSAGTFENCTMLIGDLAKKDVKSSLELINVQIINGINIKEFSLSLMDYLRFILLIKNGALEQVRSQSMDEEKFNCLEKLSQQMKSEDIVYFLNLLIEAQEKMRFSSIVSLPLEIAVVQACLETQANTDGEVKREEIKSNVAISKDSVKIGMNEQVLEQVIQFEEVTTLKKGSSKDSGNDDVSQTADLIKLMDQWTYILETVKPYNYSLEALLRQVKVVSCEDGILLLEVPYSFHQRILEAPKSRDLLESVISDVLAKSIRLKTALGKRPVMSEDIANVEVAADDEIVQIAAEIFNSDSAN